MGYGKVWKDITESSLVMNEPIETRYLFLMMLSQTDSEGVVKLTPSKMARLFNMAEGDVNAGLKRLMDADPESRTADNDGRRIELFDERGHAWRIINYEQYRNRYSREYEAERKREYRARLREQEEGKQEPKNGKATSVAQSQREKIPYEQIAELFNRICTDLKQVRQLSDTRKRAMYTRWTKEKMDSLEKWERYFTTVHDSDFLCGRTNTKWQATFDWLLQPTNMIKVYEGNYSR